MSYFLSKKQINNNDLFELFHFISRNNINIDTLDLSCNLIDDGAIDIMRHVFANSIVSVKNLILDANNIKYSLIFPFLNAFERISMVGSARVSSITQFDHFLVLTKTKHVSLQLNNLELEVLMSTFIRNGEYFDCSLISLMLTSYSMHYYHLENFGLFLKRLQLQSLRLDFFYIPDCVLTSLHNLTSVEFVYCDFDMEVFCANVLISSRCRIKSLVIKKLLYEPLWMINISSMLALPLYSLNSLTLDGKMTKGAYRTLMFHLNTKTSLLSNLMIDTDFKDWKYDSYINIVKMFIIASASMIKRISNRSAMRRLPIDMVRMVADLFCHKNENEY